MAQSRPASDDDLPRIRQLAELARAELEAERGGAVWGRREAPPLPRDAELAAALHDATACVQIGCLDGYPVGFGIARVEVLRTGERLAVVGDLYVEPPFREVGVGEAIMDALLAWAERAGCDGIDALVLPGMRESKNFFERYGMKARAILVHRPVAGEPSPTVGDGADR
jgi:GNAT superfamily N-acetyltransferase